MLRGERISDQLPPGLAVIRWRVSMYSYIGPRTPRARSLPMVARNSGEAASTSRIPRLLSFEPNYPVRYDEGDEEKEEAKTEIQEDPQRSVLPQLSAGLRRDESHSGHRPGNGQENGILGSVAECPYEARAD